MSHPLTSQITDLAGDLAELTDRVRLLVTAADYIDAANEDEALALVDALAGVRDMLRRTEGPLRAAVWHAEHLDQRPITSP